MTITETLAEVRGHLQFADVKTKAARRTLDVPDFLAVMLAQHLAARGVDGRKPDALVFVSAGGGPLRAGDLARAEALLTVMDDVYGLLVAVDYPDAVTGGLRRTTDGFRAVLERTRSDLTTTLLQSRLQASIDRALTTTEWDPR